MDTVEGTLTVGTAVKWFSVLAKRGEGNWNPTVVVKKTQVELRKIRDYHGSAAL